MQENKIRIEKILHQGEKRIALFFDFDRKIIEMVKEIEGRRYSASKKCWHFPFSEENFRLLEKICGQIISNLQNEGEARLSFSIPKEAFNLRKMIKAITNSRWHNDEKTWSIPDTNINRAFLDEKSISFKLERRSFFPRFVEKQKKLIVDKKEKKYENQISLETSQAVKNFKEWMGQKRYSKSTIKTYIGFILHFFARMEGKGWDEIEMKDIREYNYKKFILGKQSYSAQNQFINAIKLFYQLQDKGKVLPGDIERPRRERHLPDVLTKKDIASIIRCASNIKHKCLLAFVYGGGLRIGEALSLRLRDIREDEKLLYIRMAKGKKDRRVPLSQKMMELYRDYRASHMPQNYLFEGQKGGKYSRTSAARVLQKCLKKAGIQGDITLHTLRHSYATHLMESGVGLRYIQEILGHSSPKTTMIYTHISGKRLSEIKSPLDDLGI